MLYATVVSFDVGWRCVRSVPQPFHVATDPRLRLNYTWINQDRKSVQLPAPTYIDYVMTWAQNLIDDESVFPTKSGTFALFRPLPRPVLFSHYT